MFSQMFSQMCVIPSVYGGVLASQHVSQVSHDRGVCIRGVCLQGGLHPGAGGWADLPRYMGYGQQASGTHPTGMHSCYSSCGISS